MSIQESNERSSGNKGRKYWSIKVVNAFIRMQYYCGNHYISIIVRPGGLKFLALNEEMSLITFGRYRSFMELYLMSTRQAQR